MTDDASTTKALSNADRIKSIRKDLTRLARTIDDPGNFRKQSDLDSLMIRIVRLAEVNGLEVYTRKRTEPTVMPASHQP